MKTGIHTSEFWLTVAVDVAALATSLATVLPAKYAAAAGTVATGLYAISRGWAKSAGELPSAVRIPVPAPAQPVVPVVPDSSSTSLTSQ